MTHKRNKMNGDEDPHITEFAFAFLLCVCYRWVPSSPILAWDDTLSASCPSALYQQSSLTEWRVGWHGHRRRTWMWDVAPLISQYHAQWFPQKDRYKWRYHFLPKKSLLLTLLAAKLPDLSHIQVSRPAPLKGTIALTHFLASANIIKSSSPHPFFFKNSILSSLLLPSTVS